MQGAKRWWIDRTARQGALAVALLVGAGVAAPAGAEPLAPAQQPSPNRTASAQRPADLLAVGLQPRGQGQAEAEQQPGAAPLRLSLRRALDLGLENSLSLRGSALAVQEGQALVGLTDSRFLPKIDIVGLGTYGQVGSSIGFISNLSTIGDLSLNLGGDGYAVIQNTFLNLGVTLTLPVVDFGRGPLRQAARSDLKAARAELGEQERRSRFDIISTYLTAQLSDALVPVWESSLTLSSTLLRDARAIRRRGLAARIDTLQAEALVETDRQGLAEALAQQQVARSALARVLNRPPRQTVIASDNLVPGPAWSLGRDATLERSLTQRPALEGLEEQRRAQQARVQLARASRLPSIGLMVGGGLSGDWLNQPVLSIGSSLDANGHAVTVPGLNAPGNASGSFYDWGVVLNLRQPLYDGGASRSSTALAQRRLERTEVALEQTRQAITQNVETWYASHQAAGPQMTAAAAAARAGEESMRDALLRYRAGIAPITEPLLAHRNLQQARSAAAAAIYRWNLSRVGLELETGLPVEGAPQEAGRAGAYSSRR